MVPNKKNNLSMFIRDNKVSMSWLHVGCQRSSGDLIWCDKAVEHFQNIPSPQDSILCNEYSRSNISQEKKKIYC